MHYVVYQITNKLNDKIYVGCHKTANIDDDYMGSGKLLHEAYEKNGTENFTKEILHQFDTSKEMFDKEKIIVDKGFVARKDTYNIKTGGNGGWDHYDRTGCTRSPETRAKISNSLQGNTPWMKGKQHTEESKKKLSIAGKGRKHSLKTLAKISKALTGRISPKKGTKGLHKHSAETKQKMSESAKGHTRNVGRTHSEETKRKMSDSAKKRWQNQE